MTLDGPAGVGEWDEAPTPAEALVPQASAPAGSPFSGQPLIRASDAERESVVTRLAEASGEGRLTLEELSQRIDAAYSATTRAELEPLVADLPAPRTVEVAVTGEAKKPKRRWVVAVMGEHDRLGRWRVSPRTTVVTVMGESKIDLRQAVIEDPEVHITLALMMGEQRVIVPRGVEVEVTGFVFMGSRKIHVEDAPLRPGTPRVYIRTIGMMGEVRVETH